MPVGDIVAIKGLLILHTPPAVLSFRGEYSPLQKVVIPVIGAMLANDEIARAKAKIVRLRYFIVLWFNDYWS